MMPAAMRLACLLAAVLLALPLAAIADDYPRLRPGLWELTRKSDRPAEKPQTITICLDRTVQREMYDMGLGTMKGMCSKHDFHLSGSRGEAEFVCNLGETTMHSKSVMTLDGDTAYRTVIDTTYVPPFMGQSRTHTVLAARHTGACKTGQRPGDVTLPDGRVINMSGALNGMKK